MCPHCSQTTYNNPHQQSGSFHSLAHKASTANGKLCVTWSKESLVNEAALGYLGESRFTDEISHYKFGVSFVTSVGRKGLEATEQDQQACGFRCSFFEHGCA